MNDRIPDAESSHCLENFKIAAGRTKGDFYGAVFQDTDVAKWLEAVGFSLACYPDEALEKTADEVIDLIADAQCEDGYINTYFTIKEPEKGYRRVHIEKDTKIEVSFAAPAKFVYANPQVRADSGKAAIVRVPLVYCLEEIDNSQNLPAIFVDTDAPLREEKSDLFGGIVTVKAKAKKIVESSVSDSLYSGQKPQLEDIELTAIPYPYWNNRGEGEMLMWMKELRP